MSFGVNPNPLHIPRGVVRLGNEGVYNNQQYLGGPTNDVATVDNPLIVDPKQCYSVEIPVTLVLQDNARFIKDIKFQDEQTHTTSKEDEDFYLMFQLICEAATIAMKFSSAVKYNGGSENQSNTNTQGADDMATAAEYLGETEEGQDEVYTFIEGIPSTADTKRDAMVRLWVLVQKNARFTCNFPTLISKIIAGDDFEEKKKKSRMGNKVPYESFAENYKRLIGSPQKYLQTMFQTRYGKANRVEFNIAKENNRKAYEHNYNTRGLGSPHNFFAFQHHFSIFPIENVLAPNENLASYWQKMQPEDGFQPANQNYRLSRNELYPNTSASAWNFGSYFRQHDNDVIFCPHKRDYMFHMLPSDLGVKSRLVYSQSNNKRPRTILEGPCRYLLPVRWIETVMKPKEAQDQLMLEMQKLKIVARETRPDVTGLNMDLMGRYTVGAPSNSFTMPAGTTLDNENENFLSFCLDDRLMEMLLRAQVGLPLQHYATKRNLILNDNTKSELEKLQMCRDHYTRFTLGNFRNLLLEVNGKGSISYPLQSICKCIENETPLVSMFEYKRSPPSETFDFIASFIQEKLFSFEYLDGIAHNHKEFLHFLTVGFGSTRLDSLPYALVALGKGEVGKSFLLDLLRAHKCDGTTVNCNTSSNMAHTIAHCLNVMNLYHEMAIQNTSSGNDPASRQRIAAMKAIQAAGYFRHQRVYQDPFTGKWKKSNNLLINCCSSIQNSNDNSWCIGPNGKKDPATASRFCQQEFPATELADEKGVHVKNAALQLKHYEELRINNCNKSKFQDAVICFWQWLLNDTGCVDDPTLYVFQYMQKFLMENASTNLKQSITSRGMTRVSVLNLNLIKVEAFEILFCHPPPYKRFVFTLTDTKRNQSFEFDEASESEETQLLIAKLKSNKKEVRCRQTIDGTVVNYVINKVQPIGPTQFLLQEEVDNEIKAVGRWKFETLYKENPHGLTDTMPENQIPLVGKYFGHSYIHILKDPAFQETFLRDFDSLMYDSTSSCIAAFSLGECNFYSYIASAVVDAFVELTQRQLCKSQQKYLEDHDGKKNYNYIYLGSSNGTSLYENVKQIISQNSMRKQGKRINLSQVLYTDNVKELLQRSDSFKKYRKPIKVRRHNNETDEPFYQWPPEDDCLIPQPEVHMGTNQQTIQSSMPPTQRELNEKDKFNLLKRVRNKNGGEYDFYGLVPWCRHSLAQGDNHTIVGTLKSFTYKNAKQKYCATGNGTMKNRQCFPEIGEILELEPDANASVLVNRQPNVLTSNAAKVLGCDESYAEQSITFVNHDLDDLSNLARAAQIFIVPKLKDMSKRQIDACLERPEIKRSNKLYLTQLVHESIANSNQEYCTPNWPQDALQKAAESLKSNNTVNNNIVTDETTETTVIISTTNSEEQKQSEVEENNIENPFNIDTNENESMSYTEQEMAEARAALRNVQTDDDEDYMMMPMHRQNEEDAQSEETISLNQLGVQQVGEDPLQHLSNLIDNESGESKQNEEDTRPSKKQRTDNTLFGDDDD